MRSVVVVLPASMWAMMPMFRVFSSEYCRSTSSSAFFLSTYMRRGGPGCGPPLLRILLPAVMRERFVGLRHLVRVFPLLHGGAAVVGGVQQLGRELLGHAALRAPARGADHPAHGQRRAAVGPHLHRHLVRRAADAARLHLDGRLHVVDGRLEHLQRFLLAAVLDGGQRLVPALLPRGLLASYHHD